MVPRTVGVTTGGDSQLMATTPAEGAVLVVRVWREPGVRGFRGRVTYRIDAAESSETVLAVDTPERLHAVVQAWLDGFLTGTDCYRPVENR
jgi:hypothetical protein